MTDADLLLNLKIDIGLTSKAYDVRLTALLNSAKEFIKQEGITLNIADSLIDSQLVIMYARYLWNKRNENETAMPRMLRYALNNRLFAEKGGGENAN